MNHTVMNNTVYGLSVGAADAERLAHFRAEVLGRDVTSGASPESPHSPRTGPPLG